MKNIIFLGGLFPEGERDYIEGNSKGVIQYAADALQLSLIKGLGFYYKEITLVNLPFIGSFPYRFKKFMTKTSNIASEGLYSGINVGFLNLPLIKLVSRYFQAKRYLKREVTEESVIVIYSLHSPFLQAALKIKERVPGSKVFIIVPDLPEFMSDNNTYARKFLLFLQKKIQSKLLERMDGFVLLTEYMAKELPVESRPYVIIEGIYNELDDKCVSVEKSNEKIIFYSGTLAKRYGVLQLLEAFSLIKDETYRLWICGEGDGKEDIKSAAYEDKRIVYFGQIPRREVLILQKKASLLVNPRSSEGEFTKFSFPSKTMEYLASGTPTFMYRLKGIPEEYFSYCFSSEEEGVNILKREIEKIFKLEHKERKDVGEKARRFILDYKNPETQTKKLQELILKV